MRTVQVVPEGNEISQNSLESAIDNLIRASVSGVKVEISASFLTRVLLELVRRRAEERDLMSDVSDILEED